MHKPTRPLSGAAADASPTSPLAVEVGRRRTFAIISHPDAGKATLTEKLLLFGGADPPAAAHRCPDLIL